MKRLNLKKLLAALCIVTLVCSLSACSELPENGADVSISEPEPEKTFEEIVDELIPILVDIPDLVMPPPATVKVVSVGDNLIHSRIYKQANQRTGGAGYDFTFAYENIRPYIEAADYATINQETIIDESKAPSTYPLFNSPPELGQHMVDIGFDVFSLANNHMLDMRTTGLEAAMTYWDSKDTIMHTGAYWNLDDMMTAEVENVKGINFGHVGITQYTNGLVLASGSPIEFMLTAEEEQIKQKIELTKAACDVVMVNIHWGNEYQFEPTAGQRELAQKMADWGADIIVGHHPHVIQPLEMLTAADGREVLVMYSLGNFISTQDRPARVIGGLVDYEVTKDFETGEVSIDNVKFNASITHYGASATNVTIYHINDYTADMANAHGVKAYGAFSMDYINQVVNDVISPEFLGVEETPEEVVTDENIDTTSQEDSTEATE